MNWLTQSDILYCRDGTGNWSPIPSEPLPISSNLEVEISTNMSDAWQKAYDDIYAQYIKTDEATAIELWYQLTEKEDNKMNTNKTTKYRFPVIEKVIVNGPATIVYFDDNDRVIVKRMGVDKDDLFSAVAQAYCKKAFGSTSAFHREVLNKLVIQEPKKAKKNKIKEEARNNEENNS